MGILLGFLLTGVGSSIAAAGYFVNDDPMMVAVGAVFLAVGGTTWNAFRTDQKIERHK